MMHDILDGLIVDTETKTSFEGDVFKKQTSHDYKPPQKPLTNTLRIIGPQTENQVRLVGVLFGKTTDIQIKSGGTEYSAVFSNQDPDKTDIYLEIKTKTPLACAENIKKIVVENLHKYTLDVRFTKISIGEIVWDLKSQTIPAD